MKMFEKIVNEITTDTLSRYPDSISRTRYVEDMEKIKEVLVANSLTDTDFALIKRLIDVYKPAQWGIVSGDEIHQIKRCLRLERRDVLQLRNLRNTVVMMCSERSDVSCDWISAVTHVIDSEIIARGAEI